MNKKKNVNEKEKWSNISDNIEFGKRYEILRLIGDGAIGKCFLTIDHQSNEKRVIKVIKNERLWESLCEKSSILLGLKDNNIVKIFSIEYINGYPCVIQEYISGNSLDTFFQTTNITFETCICILHDILYALNCLQKNNLSHKDIKPSNIIYDPVSKKATLVDIDYLTFNNTGAKKYLGTIKYSAPEQVIDNSTSIAADIYSLGLVVSELIIGKIPFRVDLKLRNSLIEDQLENILCTEVSLSNVSKQLCLLLKSMLAFSPEERISIEDAILKTSSIEEAYVRTELKDFIIHNVNFVEKEYYQQTFNPISLIETTVVGISITVPPKDHDINTYEDHNLGDSSEKTKNILKSKKQNGTRTYREQLISEYDNILLQAKITFGLWVSAVILCYLIIFIAIRMLLKGQYMEGIIITLLDAFIIGVQKLFNIREDHYRNLVEKKMQHLEMGDYIEYAFEKVDCFDDPRDRTREAMLLLKQIKECSKQD